MRRVHVIGVGPGDPDQVTLAALSALRSLDVVLVTDKSTGGEPDPLALARERLLARHLDEPPAVVAVPDPPRERRPERTGDRAAYVGVVDDWHAARAAAWSDALDEHAGTAGVLVWGDPAFYDSTIRVLGRIPGVEVVVTPGISSLQLLAARHGIVLHEVGQALHVTTGRLLREAVEQGQDNLVVMLNRDLDLGWLPEPEAWRIWWGANLGTPGEELVTGTVAEAADAIGVARTRARERAGWVMDVFALRRERS